MGEVFLAEHAVIGKKVAIKILRAEFVDREDITQRFLQEARSASDIRHDHIVDITDFGHSPSGRPFFVMEYLEGESLCDTLKQGGAMDWQRARYIAIQICRALQAAHDKGVIHRDVKPGNCLRITKNGDPDFIKVLDFGIAKIINDDSTDNDLTETGMVMGTARYMSPEQAQSLPLDARTDIYSVGIILYQMITGRVPFNDGGFVSIISKQVNASPPTFEAVASDLDAPPGIEAIVMRALAKFPTERFPTVGDMADALEAVSTESQVVAMESQAGATELQAGATELQVAAQVGTETVESRAGRMPLFAALAVLLGLGAWVMFAGDKGSKTEPQVADAEIASLEDKLKPGQGGLAADVKPAVGIVPPGSAGPASDADSAADPGADSLSDQGDGEPAADVDANGSGAADIGSSKSTNKTAHKDRKKTKSTSKAKKKASPEKASAEVPEKLTSADIRAVLGKIEVAKCSQLGALPGMKVKVKLMISADGTVASADALKPFKGVALGRCVASAAKTARFGKAERGQIYTHAFKL